MQVERMKVLTVRPIDILFAFHLPHCLSYPVGCAFILRCLDTGAIGLTTMFCATFLTASNKLERIEVNWVKANFDNSVYGYLHQLVAWS